MVSREVDVNRPERSNSGRRKVWVVPGGRGDETVEQSLSNKHIGIGLRLQHIDLSSMKTEDEITAAYTNLNAGKLSKPTIREYKPQVVRFVLNMNVDDYVLMPDTDGERVYFGVIESKLYFESESDYGNCRKVAWRSETLNRSKLPSFPDGRVRISEADESLQAEFFELIEEYDRTDVWIVRGGADAHAVSAFLERGYVGIGFDLQDDDLSLLDGVDEVRALYLERNPGGSSSNQIIQFCLEMKQGDYVIMPGPGSRINHYGRITSDVYNDGLDPYKNKRNVEWSDRTITREDLDLSGYRPTVTHLKGDVRDKFLDIIANRDGGRATQFKMPEDSWVSFHLEVGRKLIDGEWWKPANRGKFGDLVTEVAKVAGVIDTETMDGWTPDPYSLYLAFNTASEDPVRQASYEKTRELFGVAADLPERGIYARRYGVFYWSEMRLEETGIDFLWDFLRFLCDADLVNDSDDEAEFVRRFDTALSHDVPGMASATLSQWLYWIDPTKYLLARRIHASELGLAGHLGLAEPIEGGVQYIAALKAVDEFAKVRGMTMLDINRESTTREMLGLEPSIGLGDNAYAVGVMLDEGVFLEGSQIERMIRILRSKQNLILQGPPGVGKTFISRKLAYVLMGEKGEGAEKRITSVQFHQSYSYEDFVGGFRPDVVDGQMVFTRQDGPFLRMCAEARAHPDDDYVMLIDEINRGNLSRVFGELLMLIEADKRKPEFAVKLQHRPDDDEGFFVPENVYIIGTMNLADRSLTGMNVAMRRRFGFVDLKPQFNERVFTDWLARETDMPPEWREWINSTMFDLNQTIARHPSLNENYAVGHSFFCPRERTPEEGWNEWYETVVEYEIRPLLKEYWFDDPDTARTEANKLLRDG